MIWELVKHFSPKESWGDPNRVNGYLILTMDIVREVYGCPFVILNAFSLTGHSENSQHYLGNATDFFVLDPESSFYNQVLKIVGILEDLQIAKHVGLGIYPQWKHPGFHLDVRGSRARWGRLDGKYVSFAQALVFTRQNTI